MTDEDRDRIRIGITEQHGSDKREGNISNAAGYLYFSRRERERAEEKAATLNIKDPELNKLVGLVGKTHAAKLAEGEE